MQNKMDLGPLFTITEQELTRPVRRREDRDVLVLRVELDAQRREVASLTKLLEREPALRRPAPKATEADADRLLLTGKEIRHALGISAPTLWRWIKGGQFPRQILIGSLSRWRKDEVEAWLSAKAQSPAGHDVVRPGPRKGRSRGRTS